MIEYFIKRPNKKSGTKNYKLICRVTHPDGRRVHETLMNESVEALNKQLHAGVLAPDFVEEQLRAIIKKLRGDSGAPQVELFNNPENIKILKRFWAQVYDHRILEDKKSAYNDYRRAVEALGKVSLITADALEIQRVLNAGYTGKKHRRIASKLMIIRQHLGQPIELTLAKKPRIKVRHLTREELGLVLGKIEDPLLRLAYTADFYCGARDGELFALEAGDYREQSVYIERQLTPALHVKDPKWGSVRNAFVPPDGREFVKAWCEVDAETKAKLRVYQHRHKLKAACRSLWPSRTDKHCTIHDLRHSYAIYLGKFDISLERIAKFIGDTITTTEQHYAGYMPTDDDVIEAERKFKKS